jgi:hypothetical protein
MTVSKPTLSRVADTRWPELGTGTVIAEGQQISEIKWDNHKLCNIPPTEYVPNKYIVEETKVNGNEINHKLRCNGAPAR